MRDIHGDQRDSAGGKTVRDNRREVTIRLEFDHQIHMLLDELFGVLPRDFPVVLIIKNDEFDAGGNGGGSQAFGNRIGEGKRARLSAKAEAHLARTADQAIPSVLRARDIAPVHQRPQDPKDGGLGDPRALMDLLERQWSLVLFQQFQNIQALRENGNEINCFSRSRHSNVPGERTFETRESVSVPKSRSQSKFR